jgi:hypothetical protein
MANNQLVADIKSDPKHLLTTNEFAAEQRLSPLTVRKNLCEQGSHLGAKPIKLANKRLLWRAEDLKAILAGGRVK